MDFLSTMGALSEFRAKLNLLQQAVHANRVLLERVLQRWDALVLACDMSIDGDEAAASSPSAAPGRSYPPGSSASRSCE